MAAIDERVEYADRDTWVSRQRGDALIAIKRIAIVDQQSYANTPVGGTQQGVGQ